MSDKTVIGVEHSHDGVSGLVLRTGQKPPSHYQRHPSVIVTSIIIGTQHRPVRCMLGDANTIYIATRSSARG